MTLAAPETASHEMLATQEIDLSDAEFWDYAASQFGNPSEQTSTEAAVLLARKQELLRALMEQAADAFMNSASDFAAMYYADRAVLLSDGAMRFFTRDSNSQMLDSITTISDDPDGIRKTRHVMHAPLTYGFDNRVEIVARADGEFHVYTEVYKNGFARNLEVTGTSLATDIMEEYFASALRAANAVKGRDEEAKAAADQDALRRYARYQASEYKYL